MPAGLELAVHRIVQEGVTNAIRHVGAGASLRVEVGYAPEAVTVRVRDGGRPVPPDVTPPGGGLPRGGHGLVGLRERVAVYGGALRVGAQLDGGWLVDARLPVPRRSEPATRLEVRR
jgi:signal transduction histidine kinase